MDYQDHIRGFTNMAVMVVLQVGGGAYSTFTEPHSVHWENGRDHYFSLGRRGRRSSLQGECGMIPKTSRKRGLELIFRRTPQLR